MDNKTAMQELIEYFNKNGFTINEISISVLDNLFTELLKKEKQQIIDARTDGIIKGHKLSNEDYFTQKYEQ